MNNFKERASARSFFARYRGGLEDRKTEECGKYDKYEHFSSIILTNIGFRAKIIVYIYQYIVKVFKSV